MLLLLIPLAFRLGSEFSPRTGQPLRWPMFLARYPSFDKAPDETSIFSDHLCAGDAGFNSESRRCPLAARTASTSRYWPVSCVRRAPCPPCAMFSRSSRAARSGAGFDCGALRLCRWRGRQPFHRLAGRQRWRTDLLQARYGRQETKAVNDLELVPTTPGGLPFSSTSRTAQRRPVWSMWKPPAVGARH